MTMHYFIARKNNRYMLWREKLVIRKEWTQHLPSLLWEATAGPSQQDDLPTEYWFPLVQSQSCLAARSIRQLSGSRRQCSENWLHFPAFLGHRGLLTPQIQRGKPQSQAQGAQSLSRDNQETVWEVAQQRRTCVKKITGGPGLAWGSQGSGVRGQGWAPGSQGANAEVERHQHTLRFYPQGSREPQKDLK